MSQFVDQTVLITGAASGFGKLLAQTLASNGAKLVLGDRNEAGVKSVGEELETDCIAVGCDVTNESQVRALVDAAIEQFGRLDIAVNNAGLSSPMKSILETTEADMDINFGVNAKGVFFGMKYQIPPMLKQGGGCILNVSSMAGLNGAPKLAAYAASKHAVVGLTKTAALEFARSNIRINVVCPFFSPTPLVTEGIDKDTLDMIEAGSPMKRFGSPQEMVSAMLHIISPDNTYMTGQAIAVDGGISAR